MEVILAVFALLAVSIWLWIGTLSILCLFLDPDLEPVQRWGQALIVLFVPYFGASLILKLINDHSPEVISRFYIPWPFNLIVQDKQLRGKGPGGIGEEIPGVHSASNHDGGGGGGGGGD